jgi:Tol biopolymer transport system component
MCTLIIATGQFADAGQGKGQILFTSDRDGSSKLYSMNSDGTNVQLVGNGILEEGGIITAFTVAPNGRKAAFISNKNRDGIYETDELFLLDLITGQIVMLTNDGFDKANPVWLNNSADIFYLTRGIFDNYTEIVSINIGTHQSRRVINSSTIAYNIGNEEDVNIKHMTISPDSNQILMWVQTPLPDVYDILVLMKIDGTGTQQITRNEENAYDPSWSADRNIIYYICGFDHYYEICRLDMRTFAFSVIPTCEASWLVRRSIMYRLFL